MSVYQKGDTARIAGTFTDPDGAAQDATLARLKMRNPAGTIASVTYPGTATKSATGAYYADVALTSAGNWQAWWEFETDGVVVAVTDAELLRVLPVPT